MAKHLFKAGVSGNPAGRPKGAKAEKTKIEELLGADLINTTFKEDFKKGLPGIRQFAYDHFYGKAVIKTDNDNKNTFPEEIRVTFTDN